MTMAALFTITRRYRPVAVAVAVASVVILLVPPLHTSRASAPTIAPFTATPRLAPPVPIPGAPPGSATAVGSPPAAAIGDAAEGATAASGGDSARPGALALGTASTQPSIAAVLPSTGTGAIAVADDGTVLATLADVAGAGAIAALHTDGRVSTLTVPGTSGLTALAVVGADDLFVAGTAPAEVVTMRLADGAVDARVPIPDVPSCIAVVRDHDCDAATRDAAPRPVSIAIDAAGDAFVADAGQSVIWRIRRGSTVAEEWLADSAFSAPSGDGGLVAIVFDGAGNLVVVTGPTLSSTTGSLYVQAIGDDGTPSVRRRLAVLSASPSGAVLGITGSVFIPLPALRVVLQLNNQGSEVQRTKLDDFGDRGPLGGAAFRGQSVLVATPTAIIAVPVGELGSRTPGAGG